MVENTPHKPRLKLIKSGKDSPKQPPYLVLPAERFFRNDEDRNRLLNMAKTPQAEKDIRRMNAHWRLNQPFIDRATHHRLITGKELVEDPDPDLPPCA